MLDLGSILGFWVRNERAGLKAQEFMLPDLVFTLGL